jgi:hypothetical protein
VVTGAGGWGVAGGSVSALAGGLVPKPGLLPAAIWLSYAECGGCGPLPTEQEVGLARARGAPAVRVRVYGMRLRDGFEDPLRLPARALSWEAGHYCFAWNVMRAPLL